MYFAITAIWLGFFALLGYIVKEKCEDALDVMLVLNLMIIAAMIPLLLVTAGIITSFK